MLGSARINASKRSHAPFLPSDNDHKFIADTVNNAGYKATFFVNGANYGCIYDEANVSNLRYSYAQGHQICSHTWGHVVSFSSTLLCRLSLIQLHQKHLNQMSDAQLDRQVRLVEDALYKVSWTCGQTRRAFTRSFHAPQRSSAPFLRVSDLPSGKPANVWLRD